MKKLLYLFLALTVACNNPNGQKNDKVESSESIAIEDEILLSLSESQKKSLFNLLLNAQDKAAKEAAAIIPDNSKFDERIEKERELQDKYELEVYQTQSWWNKIDGDINVAIKIRNKISMLGVTSGWL